MPAEPRKDIRSRMRRLRRDLDASGRATAAANLCARLTACEGFKSAQRIAAYLPNDGEINTWHIIRQAWNTGRTVYLPVIQTDKTLGFAMFSAETNLDDNRYGIPEPQHSIRDMIAAAELDLVLLPTVAFDDAFFRLGMGGGYYDRTFGFVRDTAIITPQLIAIAYDFQRVSTVYPETWDVPAARIVTDKTIY